MGLVAPDNCEPRSPVSRCLRTLGRPDLLWMRASLQIRFLDRSRLRRDFAVGDSELAVRALFYRTESGRRGTCTCYVYPSSRLRPMPSPLRHAGSLHSPACPCSPRPMLAKSQNVRSPRIRRRSESLTSKIATHPSRHCFVAALESAQLQRKPAHRRPGVAVRGWPALGHMLLLGMPFDLGRARASNRG